MALRAYGGYVEGTLTWVMGVEGKEGGTGGKGKFSPGGVAIRFGVAPMSNG